MWLKVHEPKGSRIIAICDKTLIGRVLSEGKYNVDIQKHKDFYFGESATLHTIENAVHDFSSINAVGEKSVASLIQIGLAKEENIKYVNNVPILHIYRL